MKLIIIDTSVIIFQLVGQLERLYAGQWTTDAQIYIEQAVAFINENGWLPNLADYDCKVVWVEDRKPYWRSQFISDYKGHRGEKPSIFPKVYECFESAPNVTRLAFPGYEADDIAAAIIRMWDASSNGMIDQILLATVDSDWMGLLLNRNVFWCNTAYHMPRLRQKTEAYTWLRGKWNKQPNKWKKEWELPNELLFKPQDIWEWKLKVGDRADNLDAGCARYMIDLLSPPRIHDLVHTEGMAIQRAIAGAKLVEKNAWRESQEMILYLGASLPIDPLFVSKELL